MRYRLISGKTSWHVEGTVVDAEREALSQHNITGAPVCVYEAPFGGIVRYVATVPEPPRKRGRR